MGRQREPVGITLPFVYWVYGRPISHRNADGSKPTLLGKWRAGIDATVDRKIDEDTKGRRYSPHLGAVNLSIYWLSQDRYDQTHPDIDNILKPLIDVLNGRVISDDILVHTLHAEKGSINEPPKPLEEYWQDIQLDPSFIESAEVTIILVEELESK